MTQAVMTKDWWRGVINDPARFARWIQKLQLTEIGGAEDHYEYMERYSIPDREERILTQIAIDEQKHSDLLVHIMNDRGIMLKERGAEGTVSYYWTEMYKEVQSLKDYCGVNYYGEALAADRFEIIRSMPETPSDIKGFIDAALPDEIFHRETLMRLAGEDTMEKLKTAHDRTFERLIAGTSR